MWLIERKPSTIAKERVLKWFRNGVSFFHFGVYNTRVSLGHCFLLSDSERTIEKKTRRISNEIRVEKKKPKSNDVNSPLVFAVFNGARRVYSYETKKSNKFVSIAKYCRGRCVIAVARSLGLVSVIGRVRLLYIFSIV